MTADRSAPEETNRSENITRCHFKVFLKLRVLLEMSGQAVLICLDTLSPDRHLVSLLAAAAAAATCDVTPRITFQRLGAERGASERCLPV